MTFEVLVVVATQQSAAALRKLLGPDVMVCTPFEALTGHRFDRILLCATLRSDEATLDERLRQWRDEVLPCKLKPGGLIEGSPLQ